MDAAEWRFLALAALSQDQSAIGEPMWAAARVGSLPIRRSARPLEVAPGTPCERPLPRAEEAVACRRRSLAQRRSSARARADAVELGFLLVAERAVKLDERGLNGVERPHHRVEALLHRGETAGRGERLVGHAAQFEQIGRLRGGVFERFQGGVLLVGEPQSAGDAVDRQAGGARSAAAQPGDVLRTITGGGTLVERVESALLLVGQRHIEQLQRRPHQRDGALHCGNAGAHGGKARRRRRRQVSRAGLLQRLHGLNGRGLEPLQELLLIGIGSDLLRDALDREVGEALCLTRTDLRSAAARRRQGGGRSAAAPRRAGAAARRRPGRGGVSGRRRGPARIGIAAATAVILRRIAAVDAGVDVVERIRPERVVGVRRIGVVVEVVIGIGPKQRAHEADHEGGMTVLVMASPVAAEIGLREASAERGVGEGMRVLASAKAVAATEFIATTGAVTPGQACTRRARDSGDSGIAQDRAAAAIAAATAITAAAEVVVAPKIAEPRARSAWCLADGRRRGAAPQIVGAAASDASVDVVAAEIAAAAGHRVASHALGRRLYIAAEAIARLAAARGARADVRTRRALPRTGVALRDRRRATAAPGRRDMRRPAARRGEARSTTASAEPRSTAASANTGPRATATNARRASSATEARSATTEPRSTAATAEAGHAATTTADARRSAAATETRAAADPGHAAPAAAHARRSAAHTETRAAADLGHARSETRRGGRE